MVWLRPGQWVTCALLIGAGPALSSCSQGKRQARLRAMPPWELPHLVRRVALARGRGQDGKEVTGPAREELAGGTILTRDRGRQRATRGVGDVKLDPFRVNVQFHRDPCSLGGQGLRQVGGRRGHAPREQEITVRVLGDGAAGHERATAEGGAPQTRIGRRTGRLPR